MSTEKEVAELGGGRAEGALCRMTAAALLLSMLWGRYCGIGFQLVTLGRRIYHRDAAQHQAAQQ